MLEVKNQIILRQQQEYSWSHNRTPDVKVLYLSRTDEKEFKDKNIDIQLMYLDNIRNLINAAIMNI